MIHNLINAFIAIFILILILMVGVGILTAYYFIRFIFSISESEDNISNCDMCPHEDVCKIKYNGDKKNET